MKTFNLQDVVNTNYLVDLAQKHINEERLVDASNLIVRFKLTASFDISGLIMKLIAKKN
jgi:hypothetical protein